MKVFAEYFELDGLSYRRNTLLQFGKGWNLIGNVVLANPGSAEPLMKISKQNFGLISGFYDENRFDEQPMCDWWYEFSVDSTMGFIEKLFNGWYLAKTQSLDGVIQLFNTFNLKNQNIHEAIEKTSSSSEFMFSENIYTRFNDKPTYFGFGKDVLKNHYLHNVAENIFVNSSKKIRTIYKRKFSENHFYHPMYVNRAYKQAHFKKYKNEVLSKLIV
ncbi:hypothetical protein [Methylophaga sp. OBS3]|uniref:hypothetical protein n=1 Tax=Methylophaga sp. OBS3 TaxID=2991934 RepID=UPI0022557756|nr:hypothetical protein [Methylophaga sp. OBS3]MCX4190807.1 hypothetical protein [Methylophaga sp. OBS3]